MSNSRVTVANTLCEKAPSGWLPYLKFDNCDMYRVAAIFRPFFDVIAPDSSTLASCRHTNVT